MLVNVRSDASFQRFLDRREQELHVAMVPVIAQGIRLTIRRGSHNAQEQVVKRGEAVLIAHTKRIFREVFASVNRRRLLPSVQKQNDDDDWDSEGIGDFMDAQLSWIRTEAARSITRISHSLAADIRDRVFEGVQEGWSNDKIARELADDIPDMSRNRAAVISRTETHGSAMWAFDETLSFKQIDIQKKQWFANLDGRVRDSHRAMHGVILDVDQPFELDGGDVQFPGDDSLGADAGELINCLTGDAVVSARGVRAATRHLYRGQLVEIRTKRGVLKATPNHPIATPRGWVAAGRLNVGDDVFYAAEFDSALAPMHGEDRPATLEQIFDTFASPGLVNRVRSAAVNFHGDRPTSDVDVVFADRQLLEHFKTSFAQSGGDFRFATADKVTGLDSSLRAASQFLRARLAATTRLVRGLSIGAPLLGRALSGEELVAACGTWRGQAGQFDDAPHGRAFKAKVAADARFWPASGAKRLNAWKIWREMLLAAQANRVIAGAYDAGLSDVPVDARKRYAGGRNNFVERFPFPVQVHKVVDCVRREFRGHVFNLETADGFYLAHGALTRNCRCVCRYFTEEGLSMLAEEADTSEED